MIKILMTWMTAFSFFWAQTTAWALTPKQIGDVKSFLSETRLNSKEQSVKNVVGAYKNDLPYLLQKDLELFIKENPKLVIPRIDYSTQGTGDDQKIILKSVDKDGSFTITLSGTEEQMKMVIKGSYKGKDFEKTLSQQDFTELTAAAIEQHQVLTSPVLYPEQVEKLSLTQKKDYYQALRDLAETMEKVQNESLPKPEKLKKSKESVWMFKLFIDQAVAAEKGKAAAATRWTPPSGDCVVAGNSGGNYAQDNEGLWYCQMDSGKIRGSCSSGQVQCNPFVYGDGACIQGGAKQATKYATKDCNDKISIEQSLKKMTAGHQPEKKLSGQKDFDSWKGKFDSKLSELEGYCAKVESNPKALADQKGENGACPELKSRVAALKNLTCSNFESALGKNRLECSPVAAAPAPVTAPPPPQACVGEQQSTPQKPCTRPNPPAPPAAPTAPAKTAEQCAKLGSLNGEGLGCGPQQQAEVQGCPKYKICSCGTGFKTVQIGNYLFDSGCEKDPRAASETRPAKEPKEKESSGSGIMSSIGKFFSKWGMPLFIGAAVLGLSYYANKQYLKQYYGRFTPPATPVPPPIATIPVPNPVNRPAPAAQ